MGAYLTYTDSELLEQLRAGNRQAFEEIYRRHWKDMYRTAYLILHDEAASTDIVQDIFVWCWEKREAMQVSSLGGYLAMAVRYKVANYIRREKVRARFFDEVEKLQIPEGGEELTLELKELRVIIAQFTDELPGRCRDIFYLSRFEYLSNKEIAARLGISEKTVENQITIALKRLRMRLGALGAWMVLFL
ncbi:RNA polymerase sigma factor [Chitinophaga deserti]|uniref:RNA polymerase sigma factor n=1 Tax=Chitinophaga deserti TaxID=2164099 RepID=UPI000D6BEF2E|nr:RNA polymerase sigma-70 factor [Chitinophaga deserti]